jgi:hypothetical protein
MVLGYCSSQASNSIFVSRRRFDRMQCTDLRGAGGAWNRSVPRRPLAGAGFVDHFSVMPADCRVAAAPGRRALPAPQISDLL